MEGIKYKRHRVAKQPFSRLTASLDEKLTAQAKIDAINKQAHADAAAVDPNPYGAALMVDFSGATLADLIGTGRRGKCTCGVPCSTVYKDGLDVWIHDGAVDFPHDPTKISEITLV